MFDDKTVKLKKDQFIEAESVAYLVEDVVKRKLAFANTCTLFAFKNYIEKVNYSYKPVTNINLFRVPMVYQKFEISDLYLGNIRVDVRASFDGKVFPIPKIHIQNSIAADYYVVYMGTKNPLKCEPLGYIRKENLIFDSQDENYYYISVSILNPIEDLKQEISDYRKEPKSFYETEHKNAQENFGAFLDGDLDDVKSADLINHLLECEECRRLFVEYSFLEDVLTAVNHYPDLKDMIEPELNKNIEQPSIEETPENIEPQDVTEDAIEEIIPMEDVNISQDELDFNDAIQDISFSDELSEIADETAEDAAITEEVVSIESNIQDALNDFDDEDDNFMDFSNQVISDDENIVINDEYTISENNEPTDVADTPKISIEEKTDDAIENIDDNSSESFTFDEELAEDSQYQEEVTEVSQQQEEVAEINDAKNDDEQNITLEEKSEENIINTETTDNIDLDMPDFETVDTDNAQNDISLSDNSVEIAFDDVPKLQLEDEEAVQQAQEEYKNDEKLQAMLNETTESTEPQTQEVNFDTNWNDLFAANTPKQETNVNSSQTQYTNNDENANTADISALYAEENPQMEISKEKIEEIDNSHKVTNKKSNVPILVAAAGLAIVLIAGGGFLLMNNSGKLPTNINTSSSNDLPSLGDGTSNDMNRSMTNAFSNDGGMGLQVSKVSWQVAPKYAKNPQLKTYLTDMGSGIWNALDEIVPNILVQAPNKQAKVLIKISNMNISDMKIAESSGAPQIDDAILRCVSTAMAEAPVGEYIQTSENINLILVVNF